MQKKNLILIGYMGCGKSTIGKELSTQLGYSFLDTDDSIEQKEQCSITEIFRQKGENYFREAETHIIKELIQTANHAIISTGGGLPIREENGELLKQLGYVVYLKVSVSSVLKRLEGDTSRPLLQGHNVEEKVSSMLEFRHPKYEKVADLIINVDLLSIDEVVESVKDWYSHIQ